MFNNKMVECLGFFRREKSFQNLIESFLGFRHFFIILLWIVPVIKSKTTVIILGRYYFFKKVYYIIEIIDNFTPF